MATLTCHDYGADMDLYGSYNTMDMTTPEFLNSTFASYSSGTPNFSRNLIFRR
jgi:hypothetical protein